VVGDQAVVVDSEDATAADPGSGASLAGSFGIVKTGARIQIV
jgi:hypothetical protein